MTTQHTFPRTHRLRTRLEFSAAYDARVRESSGPLTVYALPNALSHPRLGISISRKVGIAARRNRIKRLLRESFRLSQHDLPAYDFLIIVRPHQPLELPAYQALLTKAAARLRQVWAARERQAPP